MQCTTVSQAETNATLSGEKSTLHSPQAAAGPTGKLPIKISNDSKNLYLYMYRHIARCSATRLYDD